MARDGYSNNLDAIVANHPWISWENFPLDESVTPPETEAMVFGTPYATGCDDYNEFTWYAPSTSIHTAQAFKSAPDYPTSWANVGLSTTRITHKGGVFAAKVTESTINCVRAALSEIQITVLKFAVVEQVVAALPRRHLICNHSHP